MEVGKLSVLKLGPISGRFQDQLDLEDLLDTLARIRKLKGITQREMAETLGVGQPTVAAFENTTRGIRLSTLQRYVRALGLTMKITFEDVEETG